jgi:alpha-N-arabinofuranosidase
LRHGNLQATNTRDAAERVKPGPLKGVTVAGGHIRVTLMPASWNVIHLSAD